MRKTKIICTLGPATEDDAVLRRLMQEGMNVARLNFSHGDHDAHSKTLERIRWIREELALPIATLLDTKGPEIRVKEFEGGVAELVKNQVFTLTARDVVERCPKGYQNIDRRRTYRTCREKSRGR